MIPLAIEKAYAGDFQVLAAAAESRTEFSDAMSPPKTPP
jgi:hypothetical protein